MLVIFTTVSPCAKIVRLVRASIKDWTGTPNNCATLFTFVCSGISVASKLSKKIKIFHSLNSISSFNNVVYSVSL